MLRVQPSGNSTFDTTEVAAWAYFVQHVEMLGSARHGEARIPLENGYMFTCFQAAMLQVAQQGVNAAPPPYTVGNVAPTPPDGAGTVPLQLVANGLATNLRARGYALPPGYYAITGNTVVGGGTGTWAIGDTVSMYGVAMNLAAPANAPGTFPISQLVPATFTVLTVSTGAIATMANLAQGIYEGSFPTGTTNLAKITSTSGTGTPTCTVACTFYPTLYTS